MHQIASLEEVSTGVYAYVQPDGTWWINNAGFIVGSESVILIDTCSTQRRTTQLLDAVRSVTSAPVNIVVNTHHHGDHTHGNSFTAPAAIVAHRRCRETLLATGINHYEAVFEQPDWGALRVSAPVITFESQLDLWADDLQVELHYIGEPAHTTNDVVAWIPDRKVLFTGDLVFHQGTPFVVMGSLAGSLKSIDRLRAFGADVIVPGHGPVCGPEVLDMVERYLTFVHDLAVSARHSGNTPLQAAQAADLGEFAALSDSERLVGNLHRAMAEMAGPQDHQPMSMANALADMLTLNGGGVLRCLA